MSALKREQLVRGGCCVVQSVLAPTEDKSYDSEDSLCEELEKVFEQFSKYRVKFLQKISIQDCINYCGLSLLSASYQLLSSIVLSR